MCFRLESIEGNEGQRIRRVSTTDESSEEEEELTEEEQGLCICLFVFVDVLLPSQLLFSHVWMFYWFIWVHSICLHEQRVNSAGLTQCPEFTLEGDLGDF